MEQYPTIRSLGGHIVDLKRFVYPDNKNWSATNPSIGYAPRKGYAIAIRSSNYVILPNGTYTVTTDGLIQSHVWFSELNKNFEITNLRKIDISGVGLDLRRGLEDPKLFWRDGSWWFTAVMLEKAHTPFARMVTCQLDKNATKIISLEKHAGIDTNRPEKNWMLPYKPNPNFDFIYASNATIKDSVLTTSMQDIPKLQGIRGNTNLHDLGDTTYLAVTHRTMQKTSMVHEPNSFGSIKATLRNYVHFFTRYDQYGKVIGISQGFQFYKPGVEFAAGIVADKKDFIISFGREDVSSHLAVIPQKIVLDGLRGV
jgi:hypothetical protein